MGDSLGDRMKKNYEWRDQSFLVRRIPVLIRIDGKAFHSYTRTMDKPFDNTLIDMMVSSAKQVAENMQGFKAGYVQSDEASFLLTDYDRLETEAWFDYRQQKLVSVSASMMTAFFNWDMMNRGKSGQFAFFDARAWNCPKEEVSNYMLWRSKDWERNSLGMYCSSFFSSKELHGKNSFDRHEMLGKIGKNWNKDLTERQKNGTFLLKTENGIIERTDVKATYDDISDVIEPLLEVPVEEEAV